uniref:Uncharacterized protein n=1 Tax=Cebus imitator TaxID=2715852 RepID=A0A2K5S6B6_CEBIM
MFFPSTYSEMSNPSGTGKVKFEFCFILICKVKMKTENKGYLSNLLCVYMFLYKITMC